MDAAQTTKKISPFLAVALLFAGAASAQTLTTSTSSITLSSLGQTQQTVDVSSSDGTPINFSVTPSASAGWFTVQQVSGTLGVTPATLRFTLTGTCSVGTNSCTNANVTLTHTPTDTKVISVLGSSTGGGGGGGGGSTVLGVDVNPVGLSTTFVGGGDSKSVSLTTTSSIPVNLAFAVTQGSSWLQIFPSSNTVVAGSPVTLFLSASSAGLQINQTYVGTIVVTPNGNSTQALTITVNFTVGTGSTVTGSLIPSVSSLSFGYPNGTTTALMSVGTNAGTPSFYASATSNFTNWLQVNGTTQTGSINTGSSNVFVSVNGAAAAQLSTGVYSGTLTFTSTVNSADVTQIPVTLSVNGASGGGNTTAGAAPTSLAYAYQQGAGSPPCQTVVVPNAGTYTVTPSGTPLFLYTSASSEFVGPGNILVCAAVANLSAGSYTNSLSIASNTGFGFAQSIPAQLNVYSSPVVNATVNNISGTVTCNFQSGGSCPDSTLNVTASDNSAMQISATPSASWITLTGGATQTPGSFVVHLNPSSLANGTNTGTITINASGSANGSVVVPVVVRVNGSSNTTGALTLNPSSLSFSSAASSSQTLNVSASTTTSFTASIPSSGCGWLTLSPSGSMNTNQNISVTVNPATLTAGQTYTCNISLVTSSGTQTVAVTYAVPAGAGGNVAVDKSSLTFTAQVGVAPAAQNITVSSAAGTTAIPFTASANSTGWLSLNSSGGTTPLTISASVNPTGLTPGAYSGSINIVPNGGTALQIPVSLTVSAATVVSAVSTPLSFSYIAGSSNPASQTIAVTGTGQNLPFSAQVTAGSEWLSVSPTSGSTPNSVIASVNPGTLAPNQTYNGSIVIAGTGNATGTTTIPVTLTVTAPLPTITSVTNGASFNTGGIAAGEVITIFGTAMGPSTIQSAPTGISQFPTTLGGVQVTVGGYLAPLIYVRNDQIAAIVPYEVSRPFIANPTVLVRYLTQASNGVNVPQVAAAPGLFTAGGGTGQGAILNQNLSVNSPGNPASKGEVIVLYVTGEGQTNPAGATGTVTTVASSAPLTPQPVSGGVTVTIDGLPASVQFFGEAPGLVAGVMQVNVVVPLTARSGDLPVVVKVGDAPSQLNAQGIGAVTVAVR
jgi:uncharacterized protein (TIGR03437 family)